MNSLDIFNRAKKVIPGGVNSPVRSFGAVGGYPLCIEKGIGSKLITIENKELLDFCCSWGALILGHAHPKVVEAVSEALQRGTSFGANTRQETEFAELLCELIPYVEMIRLVNSGTEAVMTAIRLARGYTNRDLIVKFEGCYHGHADYLLSSAGSGLITPNNIPSSAGIPKSILKDIIILPYNDILSVQSAFRNYADQIAAVIVEPIAGNMGLVIPEIEFLRTLQELCDKNNSILIFDEVITGFRLALTAYGNLCGITPHLTCLGKIIGGGFPIGAIGGHREIMQYLAPIGKVYQAGTLSGNPISITAGATTLRILKDENPYPRISNLGRILSDSINNICERADIPLHCVHKGGMFTIFFTSEIVSNLSTAKTCNLKLFAEFFHKMIMNGIYLPPSQFEVCFITSVHTEKDIEVFIDAFNKSIP